MYPVDNNSGLGSGPIKIILGTGIPSSKVFTILVPQNSKFFEFPMKNRDFRKTMFF